jgi:hypothetical protein
MALIIDAHAHVFPDAPLDAFGLRALLPVAKLEELRRRLRERSRPLSSALHEGQTLLRHFPAGLRSLIERVGTLGPVPLLLLESSPRDLDEAMLAQGVDYSVVIAHPPWSSNEFVLEAAERNPKLLPVVNLPPGTPRAGATLKKWAAAGARMLKIHAAADGIDSSSQHYASLLRVASGLGLPVVLHTGCFHGNPLFRDPSLGEVSRFEPWFRKYPDIRFVLAHMNYHDPAAALDLAERYPALFVDTSWQPSEVIGEAVRRLGPERVLLGTDWPLGGNNIGVCVERVRACVDGGLISAQAGERILGENARVLLGLPAPG